MSVTMLRNGSRNVAMCTLIVTNNTDIGGEFSIFKESKIRQKETRGEYCNSVIPWTVARQAPLSMEFSWQEFWSGLPSPGDLPNPEF